MRGALAAGLSLFLALASAASAGEVSIAVDDLTSGGRPHAPRSQMQPWPDPKGEHAVTRQEAESPLLCPFAAGSPAVEESPGDGTGKPAPPFPSPAREDELVALVAAMAGTHDFTMSADRRTLRVPDASAAAVRAAVARIRAQRPAFVDLSFALEAAEGAAWTTVLAGEEPVFPGDEAVFHDEIAASYLSDFDVEVAQGSQIPDPVLQLLRSGSHVTLRVLPLPGRDSAVVEADAVVATSLDAEPMHPAYSEMADIDRAVVGVERAALTLRVKSGTPATCGWTGRDGRAMRLTVTARWTAPAADAGATALVWSPLLGAGVVERSHIPEAVQSAKAEESEEMPRYGRGVEFPLAPPGIANVAAENGATLGFGNGRLDLFSGAGAAAARDALVAAYDFENRAVQLDVVALDVPKGAALPDDDPPPHGSRELLRVAAPVRMGINGLFVSAEGRTFLQDYDVEVAQASSIPDPIIGVLLTGSFTNVRVRPGLGGAPAYVDLDVVLSKLMSMDTQTVPVLVPMGVATGPHMEVDVPDGKGGTKKSGIDPLAAATPTAFRSQYCVEKPTVHQTRITVTMPLSADGRAVLRRTLPGWLGVGHELVLVVRAK